MRKYMSTVALMAALVAVAFVSLPSEALAGPRIHNSRNLRSYGRTGYLSNYGDVRIEVGPKYLRDEAQVYVNEAHVDDFDGFFQRLSLTPGAYDVEIRLDGYQTLKKRVFVQRGSTYKIRESLKPVVSN